MSFRVQDMIERDHWGPPTPRGPQYAGPGRLRKIALIGGGNTHRMAPWFDPSWEIWSHASARRFCQRDADILFDLHPKALWADPKKKFWDTSYLQWLGRNHIPIYMQKHYKDVPASMKYPFSEIIAQWQPHAYFTNHVAWMIALALSQGVTHIGLYGCHYDSDAEYGPQRGSAEFWCGVAIGRGVQIIIPPTCDLLANPLPLYGYESHPDGVRDKSYSVTVKKDPTIKKPGEKPPAVQFAAESTTTRPPLMDIGQPPAWERSGLKEHK